MSYQDRESAQGIDPPDQVPRRMAFELRHPGIDIQSHGTSWAATWKDDSGRHTLTRTELSALLDALDAALG